MNEQNIYKKNFIFVILLGIVGICYGVLDWESVVSDLVYLKYDSKTIISIIATGVSVMKVVSMLICIKITKAKRTNLVFYACMISCSVAAIICAFFYKYSLVVFFVTAYLFEVLIWEIFSGYHYTFAHNSLPLDMALNAHSKRISVFKCSQAVAIAIAGIISVKVIDNPFLYLSLLAVAVFIIAIIFTSQVKNNNYTQVETKKTSLISSLNFCKYSKHFKMCLLIRFLGKFSLTSLVVLISLKIIDSNLSFNILKVVKSLIWVVSGIGFFCTSYLVKTKKLVLLDAILKLAVVIALPICIFCPALGFAIIVMKGVLEPFNTMSNFEMLRYKNDEAESLPQKDLIVSLYGFVAGSVSSIILLNINLNVSLCIMASVLLISSILEFVVFIKNRAKNYSALS